MSADIDRILRVNVVAEGFPSTPARNPWRCRAVSGLALLLAYGTGASVDYAGVSDVIPVVVAAGSGSETGGWYEVIEVEDSTGCISAAFDGVDLDSFAIVDATHVSGYSPPHAVGFVDVTVTNGVGTSDPLVNGFEYTAAVLSVISVTPDHGPPGTPVTVVGTYFSHAGLSAGINLNAVEDFVVVDDQHITFTVPEFVEPGGADDLAIGWGGGPGQTVHTDFIVESADWLPSSLGIPVRLDIDPRFVTLNVIDPTKADSAQDQSGNGFDAAAPAGQEPTFSAASVDYNGRPVLVFGGTKALDTPAGSADIGSDPVTIIIIGHATGGSTGYAVNRDVELAAGNDASNKRRIVSAGSGASSTFDGTTPGIMILTCEGAASRIFFNSETPEALVASAHAVTSGYGWTIGNYQGGYFLPWTGPIARVIIFDVAVTQGQAEDALAGLGDDYGIAIAP